MHECFTCMKVPLVHMLISHSLSLTIGPNYTCYTHTHLQTIHLVWFRHRANSNPFRGWRLSHMVNLSYRSHFDLDIIPYFSSFQYISEFIVTKRNKKATTQCIRFTNYIRRIHMLNGYYKNQIAKQIIYHKYVKPGNFIDLKEKISVCYKKFQCLNSVL